MDTILETNAAVEAVRQEVAPEAQDGQTVRQAYDPKAEGQPKAEWCRGICPTCGGPVVSNCYYKGGKGYIVVHECWNSLGEKATCTYRKVL